MHDVDFDTGTDEEKAQAAVCRDIVGCEGNLFFPCDACEEYKKIDLFEDDFRIGIGERVFVKRHALERERENKKSVLDPDNVRA